MNLLNLKKEEDSTQDEQTEGKKFIRKGKRSTTLKERNKLSQKLLAAEMTLEVKQENLIIQEKGNPSKKYKPTKMIGSGSLDLYMRLKILFFRIL